MAIFHLLIPILLATTACAIEDGDPSGSVSTSGLQRLDPVFRWSDEHQILNWKSDLPSGLGANAGTVYAVHAGGCTGCRDLRWGSFNGTSWQGDSPITGETSTSTPSLASFGGALYMTYNHGTDVMFSRFDAPTRTWSRGFRLPITSLGAPAIAQYGSRLYFVYVNPTTFQLHWRSMDANLSLTDDVALASMFSFSPVALAAFNGRLYMVHAASGGMVYNSFDGVSWGPDLRIPGGLNGGNQASPNTPALATFGGVLHLLHNEPSTGDVVWWTEFHGTTWDVEQAISEQAGQPSLAAGATKLVMVHGSSEASHLMFYQTFQ